MDKGYIKKFDEWNEKKKKLNDVNSSFPFNEREIWWCSIGANLGYEEDGKNENFERPVIVIKKYNRHLFLALAMTSQAKHDRFHYEINNKSFVILSQQRTLSTKRIIRKIGKLSENKFEELINKLNTLNNKKRL